MGASRQCTSACQRLIFAVIAMKYLSEYLATQNMRTFWLTQSSIWREKEYLVFENERFTYGQIHERASRLAGLFYSHFGVRKGDRGRQSDCLLFRLVN